MRVLVKHNLSNRSSFAVQHSLKLLLLHVCGISVVPKPRYHCRVDQFVRAEKNLVNVGNELCTLTDFVLRKDGPMGTSEFARVSARTKESVPAPSMTALRVSISYTARGGDRLFISIRERISPLQSCPAIPRHHFCS